MTNVDVSHRCYQYSIRLLTRYGGQVRDAPGHDQHEAHRPNSQPWGVRCSFVPLCDALADCDSIRANYKTLQSAIVLAVELLQAADSPDAQRIRTKVVAAADVCERYKNNSVWSFDTVAATLGAYNDVRRHSAEKARMSCGSCFRNQTLSRQPNPAPGMPKELGRSFGTSRHIL